MYCQYPTLFENHVAFVAANALWRADVQTGHSERLTETLNGTSWPCYSPDGQTIAFVAKGDLYLVSVQGGVPERLTTIAQPMMSVGWSDDHHVVIASSFQHPFRQSLLYKVCVETGRMEVLPFGPCEFASFGGDQGGAIIQRHGCGYVSWKRYQGGTAAELWIDQKGDGQFVRLFKEINHNLLRPLWIEDRIYFLSDYEGHGNLYSCDLGGQEIKRHTDHTDFYPRHSTTDGKSIVYSCGGDIFLFAQGHSHKIPVKLFQGRLDKVRKAKDPAQDLTSYKLSHEGKHLALTTRGRLFEATPFEGPVVQRGTRDGVRYRLAQWFKDQTLLALCDEGVHETWELYEKDSTDPLKKHSSFGVEWGRIVNAKSHPEKRIVVCTNHRNELIWIDFETEQSHIIDTSARAPIHGYAWSPCGKWVVYSRSDHPRGAALCLYDTETKKVHTLLDASFMNTQPVFDPEGKYIFFLSSRCFQPQWDSLGVSMGCQEGVRPFVMVLQKEQDSPFVLPFLGIDDAKKEEEKEDEKEIKKSDETKEDEHKNDQTTGEAVEESKDEEKSKPKLTTIDLEEIDQRIIEFPLPARQYVSLAALKGQLVYLVSEEKGELYGYDFSLLKEESLVTGIDSFTLSGDGQWMTYEVGHKLRTIRAGGKADDSPDASFQRGGWFDWGRVSLVVSPQKEWVHMFDEAWRLQKELFWTERMGQINWGDIYARYRPCLERVSCFSELLGLISDLQGELGTSHAYVMEAKQDSTSLASLGAELTYDSEKKAYRIARFIKGDAWGPRPLQRPGLNLCEGDLVWAIGGQPLSAETHPEPLLERKAGKAVPLVVSDKNGENKRTVVVWPIPAQKESHLRYRQWVETNRQWVHATSQGRAGYVHIPDMQAFGYGEFLRSYLQEFDRDGLVIDARYNGGGNISYLILDFLTRKRLGYDKSRHQGMFPYPSDSPKGPMVALINEYTGSDGDIFAHSFKALDLGPLIGKRTWGGVVGIWPRYSLLDGTTTTQPEYSFWVHDVGWRVENFGVDPTIEVDITPQDYLEGVDRQLERGVKELSALIEQDEQRQKLLQTPPEEPCLAPLWNPQD